MSERQSDPYADVLTGAKLEQLLEDIYQTGAGDFAGARDISEDLVQRSSSCEFLSTKGQVRITFDLKSAATEPYVELPPPTE